MENKSKVENIVTKGEIVYFSNFLFCHSASVCMWERTKLTCKCENKWRNHTNVLNKQRLTNSFYVHPLDSNTGGFCFNVLARYYYSFTCGLREGWRAIGRRPVCCQPINFRSPLPNHHQIWSECVLALYLGQV